MVDPYGRRTTHADGREAVDESGEQPEGRPNRPAMETDRVEETQSSAEEAEGEKWGRKKREQRRNRREGSNTLHVVFHFPTASTETAAAAATVRLQ